jgi:hypothetical protein
VSIDESCTLKRSFGDPEHASGTVLAYRHVECSMHARSVLQGIDDSNSRSCSGDAPRHDESRSHHLLVLISADTCTSLASSVGLEVWKVAAEATASQRGAQDATLAKAQTARVKCAL